MRETSLSWQENDCNLIRDNTVITDSRSGEKNLQAPGVSVQPHYFLSPNLPLPTHDPAEMARSYALQGRGNESVAFERNQHSQAGGTTMNTHPGPLKVAVVGARRAGKSALTVRHLTKRYIGEYRSSIDLLYQQNFNVDGTPAQVEILDISRWTMDDGFPAEHVRWADSLLVVYSVCDKQSFQVAKYLLEHLRSRSGSYPAATLVGTQRDLEHARQVSTDSAKALALRHGCGFFEVSSAEDSTSVQSAFQHAVRVARACSEARALRRRKLSLTTVTRALGVLIKTKRPWLSL